MSWITVVRCRLFLNSSLLSLSFFLWSFFSCTHIEGWELFFSLDNFFLGNKLRCLWELLLYYRISGCSIWCCLL